MAFKSDLMLLEAGAGQRCRAYFAREVLVTRYTRAPLRGPTKGNPGQAPAGNLVICRVGRVSVTWQASFGGMVAMA